MAGLHPLTALTHLMAWRPTQPNSQPPPTSEAQVLMVHLDHELAVNVSEDPAVHPVMDEPAGWTGQR